MSYLPLNVPRNSVANEAKRQGWRTMKNVILNCALLALIAGSASASMTVDFESPPLSLGTLLTDYSGLRG